MATVTKKFRDDFELFCADRLARGHFTAPEIEELRRMIRQDLTPGPDTLRAEMVIKLDEKIVPLAIDAVEDRYRLWAGFFSDAADDARHSVESQRLGGSCRA
jgi:hypothetical protein